METIIGLVKIKNGIHFDTATNFLSFRVRVGFNIRVRIVFELVLGLALFLEWGLSIFPKRTVS